MKNNFKGLSAIAVLTMAGLQAQPPRGGGPRQMPDAPGREVVQRVCGATCHGPEIVMGRGVGQDQWLATMNSMVSRGAKISDTEFPVVLNYLVTNFPPRGAAPAGPRQGGGGLTAGADDNHVVDPVASGRGKLIYIAECVTCHGVKARGTDNGADVVRSLVVLKDRYGSTINPFLKKGHPLQSGRPSAGINPEQVNDLAHFLHDKVGDTLRSGPYNKILNVLTGNAKDGAVYFNGAGGCNKCHSATGDFAKIGVKYDPPTLQSKFLFPRTVGFGRGGGGGFGGGRPPAVKPVTVKVTTADGATAGGVLDRLDDFYVSFRDAQGDYKTIKRGKGVTITKNDPYQAHIDMLDKYTDKNMHDIVAYLESLK